MYVSLGCGYEAAWPSYPSMRHKDFFDARDEFLKLLWLCAWVGRMGVVPEEKREQQPLADCLVKVAADRAAHDVVAIVKAAVLPTSRTVGRSCE